MGLETKNIRNFAVLGHSGDGKTSLCETMLFNGKATDRIGKITDGNTVMDYDEQEISRGISISLGIASCEWQGTKFNLLDAPGFYDFEGETVEALAAADSAIVVSGPWGAVPVGAEKAIEHCEEIKMPMAVYINYYDKENANIIQTMDAFTEKYGKKFVPFNLPIMKDGKLAGIVQIRKKRALYFTEGGVEGEIPAELVQQAEHYFNQLVEVAAENDEALLEKYFEGETLSEDEVQLGIRKGIASGSTVPMFCGMAVENRGVMFFMDSMSEIMPSPLDNERNIILKGDEIEAAPVDASKPCAVKVFKTIVDAFVGKMNLVKVMRGTLKSGMTLTNQTSDKQEKVGNILLVRGKKQTNVDELVCGDIGALSKLQYTNISDTLIEGAEAFKYPAIEFPEPVITMAVGAVKNGEEEKVIQSLYRLLEEDSTFSLVKSAETGEMLICGMGETHLDVICKKVKTKFGVEAKLDAPKIPYRETIRKTVEAEGKHKKQSGGHGQYGHCKMRFEPYPDGDFLFDSEVVGGTVPKQYIPAIEKGLRECLPKGVLAGYPVVNLKAVVYDGSYHDVDSSEMAFKIAASLAYKEGLKNAKPVLLEPIMSITVTVPENYMGDIMGDMNKRRGRIIGMDNVNGKQVIHAEAPQSEMVKYATDLRGMTQGRGRFKMVFKCYEQAPDMVAQKVAADRAAELAE